MTNCPYCGKPLQEYAIKCRHCGEWINKRDGKLSIFIKRLVKSVRTYFEEQNQQAIKARYSHLYQPTDSKPLCHKKLKLFESYLTFNDRQIEFSDIYGIIFRSSSSTYNYIVTNTSITLRLFISTNDQRSLYPEFNEEIVIAKNSSLSYREHEVVQLISSLIHSKTFRYRLRRYEIALERDKYFKYRDTQFYNNGDVKTKKGKTANIKDAFKNDLLSFESSFSSLRLKYSDPFSFKIYFSKGFRMAIAGFEISPKIEVDTSYNHDVFEALIQGIITEDCTVLPGDS